MGIEFKLNEFIKKMAKDPLSVSMKETDEKRLIELADTLRDMIDNGEKIRYDRISSIFTAMEKGADICNRYLLVMQCTGKQSEIPEEVINAIKFIYSFDGEKITSMLDDDSKHMIEVAEQFNDLFGEK
jgi:hypothetical protein